MDEICYPDPQGHHVAPSDSSFPSSSFSCSPAAMAQCLPPSPPTSGSSHRFPNTPLHDERRTKLRLINLRKHGTRTLWISPTGGRASDPTSRAG